LLNAEYKNTVEAVFWELFELMLFDHIRTEKFKCCVSFAMWFWQWRSDWGQYSALIMKEMGVQSTNLNEGIDHIALEAFRSMEENDEAAKRPPSHSVAGAAL
jgi:hypothetical protein